MSANTHLQGVFSKGYTVCATALGCTVVGVDPLPGYRVAISNFCFETNGATGIYCALHPVVRTGTIRATDIASGATSVVFTGSTIFTATNATQAFITIPLKDGTFQHVYTDTYYASRDCVMLSTALLGSVAAGATCWAYDQASVVGNYRYTVAGALSATTHVESRGNAGIFYGKNPGDPMVLTIWIGTQACAIDYVSGGYITA